MKLITGRGTWYKKVARLLGQNWTIKLSDAPEATTIVNWGLAGNKLKEFKQIIGQPKEGVNYINFNISKNKYEVLQKVKEFIPVPHSCLTTEEIEENAEYLCKPFYSIGGKGIKLLHLGGFFSTNPGGYFQKRIRNRRYELRVHAFAFAPIEEWLVYKRTHPLHEEAITWNYKTGGTFHRLYDSETSNNGVFLRAKQYSKIVMDKLDVQFGAVDFIVSNDDNPLIPWFVEINFSPGLRIPFVRETYVKFFNEYL